MLIVDEDGPVWRVTLNRPDVRNAFNDELISALSETFQRIPDGVRAIVLAGNGVAFCAGGDLQWMKQAAAYTEEQNYEDALRLAQLFQAMVTCPAVIIAKVTGAAFGGGCGLIAASDVAIATENALFAFSEVRLGLVPATISPFVIAKIGHGHARALFTTGEAFGREHALRIGLVHEMADQEKIDEAVERKLKAILSAGPNAVAAAKGLAQSSVLSLEDAAKMLARVRAGDEAKEGVGAFLERRPAAFKVDR
jgi:enoyl-CoA hydratase/carnithine racemase